MKIEKRIVIRENDFPRQVLPKDSTEAEANSIVVALNKADIEKKGYPVVFHHWHTVPETQELTDIRG